MYLQDGACGNKHAARISDTAPIAAWAMLHLVVWENWVSAAAIAWAHSFLGGSGGNVVTRLVGFGDRREVTAHGMMEVRKGDAMNLHGGRFL
jgi:hypothetical protein